MKFNLTKKLENTSFKRLFVIFMSILIIFYLLNIVGNAFAVNFSNRDTYGNYGDFISGIAGILNVLIFIVLTIYVAKLGNINNKNQIETQKKIILAQFRQSELNKLIEVLENSLFGTPLEIENKNKLIELHSHTAIKLFNFRENQKFNFPILNESSTLKIFDSLTNDYYEINFIIKDWSNDQNSMKYNSSNEHLLDALRLKDELIEILQKFILDELK